MDTRNESGGMEPLIRRSEGEASGNRNGRKKSKMNIALFILLLAAIGTSIYFYRNYKNLQKDPQVAAQEEVKKVTDAIGKFMELPTDEQPTVATVNDKDKLKEQEFFKKAENGDKILIYTNAKKAILYRPSTNKIIEFAPLVIGSEQGQPQGEEKKTETK